MNSTIRIKLSVMMFLEFFIWGAWFVTLGTFLGNNLKASGSETAAVFSTQSWGAIIAPFIIGLIADRYFNAEKILGILHLAGAFLMYQMYQSADVGSFYIYVLSYMVLYMPTLALVNSVAFNQMKDPEKEFANIRVWGTIGWILAGLSISFLFHWDSVEAVTNGLLKNTFLLAGIAALVLGLLSFTLPKTPPKVSEGKIKIADIIGLDALKLLKDKNFLIFFISSIVIPKEFETSPVFIRFKTISSNICVLKKESLILFPFCNKLSIRCILSNRYLFFNKIFEEMKAL